MGAHAYIEKEDLGLTVLGTTQYSYTVGGVHRQDYDTAVYKAALCRSVAVEKALASYEVMIKARQKKLEDLGNALAELSKTYATITKDTKLDDKLSLDSTAASNLRRYGFSSASPSITKQTLMTLKQDVQHAIDQEDNELQQDSTQLQSYVTKRDDAVQMSMKVMKKVANTRNKGIGYLGS